MPPSIEQKAQSILDARLKEIFGQDLDGVGAYGAGLDPQTRKIALRVDFTTKAAFDTATGLLPPAIEGIPVKISMSRGPARADNIPRLEVTHG